MLRVGIALVLVGALAMGGRWLWVAVHVGAGYAAKVTCSLAHLSSFECGLIDAYVASEVTPLGPALEVVVALCMQEPVQLVQNHVGQQGRDRSSNDIANSGGLMGRFIKRNRLRAGYGKGWKSP